MIKLINKNNSIEYFGQALAVSNTGVLAVAYSINRTHTGIDVYKVVEDKITQVSGVELVDISPLPYSMSLALSKDGRYLFCGTAGRVVSLTIYRLNDSGVVVGKREVMRKQQPSENPNITALALSPNYKQLAIGLANDTIDLYDIGKDNALVKSETITDVPGVRSLAFTDNNVLLAGSPSMDDGAGPIYLYKFIKGEEGFVLCKTLQDDTPAHDMYGMSLAGSEDGSYILGMDNSKDMKGPLVYASDDRPIRSLETPQVENTCELTDQCYGFALGYDTSMYPYIAVSDICSDAVDSQGGTVYILPVKA